MKLSRRPATRADVDAVYPEITASFRAMAVDIDGELAGLIGIALLRPASIFCHVSPALRPHLRSMPVLRCLKWLDDEMRRYRAPVFAIRQRDEKKAPHILKRLGLRFFEIVDDDPVYIYDPYLAVPRLA